MEVFTEDIMLVVMGKLALENRENSILRNTFCHFWANRSQA